MLYFKPMSSLRFRPRLALAALAATAVLLLGCGGSGSAGSSGQTSGAGATTDAVAASNATSGATGVSASQGAAAPVSRAVFIKRGDEVCGLFSGRIFNELQRHKTEYGRGFGNTPTQKQNEEGLVDLVLPLIEEEAGEIDALGAPKGDEQKVTAIVQALETGVAETRAKPSRAFKGPNPLDRAANLSKKYGFKVCGR